MNKKGFTLTELLVVIVIMGIVSGLSIPLIRGVSQAFENKKYKTYVKAVLAAAKIYNDSYEEDLFGRKEYGCSYITYEKLEEKDLIKDIEIDNISCATNKTYVKVIKLGEKYGYSGFIGCGEEVVENGVTTVNVIDKHSKIPDDAVDTIDTTACTGSAENNISIKIDKSQVGNTFDKKKRSTKITLESGTGIDPNASLKYAWSTTPDGFGSATYNSVSFSSIASASNQETNLLKGISTTVTSSKIETPTETGTYYLLVRVDSLNDIYGSTWKNKLEVGKGKVVATSNNYISYGPFAIDNSAPTTPTVTGYKKTSSADVSSTSGLSSIDSGTCTDKFLYVVASGSSDSGGAGGVNYKMTVSGYPTGNSNNVEDAAQSTKNVNSAGTITVKYKACDSVGNCSGYTTFTSKQDRTAPTATITAKSSSTWEYSKRSYTIKCSDASDASGVSAYYWGTTNPTALSNITTTTDLSSVKGTSGLTKNATSKGTYYLGCRDAAGNFAKVSKTVDSKTCYKGTYGNPIYVNIYESSQGSTSCTGSGHWKYEFMNCSKGTDLWTVCNSGCDNTPGPRKNYVCCIKRKEDSVTCYSTT